MLQNRHRQDCEHLIAECTVLRTSDRTLLSDFFAIHHSYRKEVRVIYHTKLLDSDQRLPIDIYHKRELILRQSARSVSG